MFESFRRPRPAGSSPRSGRLQGRAPQRRFPTPTAFLVFPGLVLLTTVLVAALPAGVGSSAPSPVREPSAGLPAVDPDARPEALESARQAARGLMQGLLGELSAALAEGGPPRAVEVCSERAPVIAAAHSDESVVVGRTSERLRNPANAPDDFEASWLARLQELHRAGELPQEVARVVRTEEGPALRYLKPIVIQADLCLQCHGDREALSPEVRRILDERYPADRAVGYQKGDLRGVVTVRVPLEPSPG